MSERKPPYSESAERAVLGGILAKPTNAFEVIPVLDGDDLFLPVHREVFAVMCELITTGVGIDAVTVANRIKSRGAYALEGGAEAFCLRLMDDQSVLASDNIMHWVGIVIRKAKERKAISICADIQARAYQGDEDDSLFDDFETSVFALNAQRSSKQSFRADVTRALERYERRGLSKRDLLGIPSGIYPLDRLTQGWQAEHFIVLAGRPGMGKSAFVFDNCALNAAVHLNHPVLIFSLEMGRNELTDRMIGARARIDTRRLVRGEITQNEWSHQLYPASEQLQAAPIELEDTPGMSIAQMTAKIRRFRADERYFPRGVELTPEGEPLPGLVIVDYAQLATSPGGKGQSREQEVAAITRGLKSAAKSTRLPIIAVSQLNRSLEKREDKRPGLADLRESGAIEQDADIIIFIHRNSYYFNDDEKAAAIAKGDDMTTTEFIVGKNRHGDVGVASARWIKNLVRFEGIENRPGYTQDPEASAEGGEHWSSR